MTKSRQIFLTLFSLLLASGLMAQATEWTVNLAAVNNVNVTLSADNCQATLTPSMILSGDYDVDGDGEFPPNMAFDIVVEDGDESNGPVIDGCGSWRWVATAREGIPGQLIGFTTAWGTVNAEDKTSPELQVLPVAPSELFCSELDGINLNTLANSVSRCFRVDGRTGAPLSVNFFNTPLGRKLSAGGGIPTFFDACSDITVCVNDLVSSSDGCSDRVITRIFTATDGDCPSVSGEANAPTVAQYEITFTRPSIVDVQPVAATVEFDCTEFSAADPNPQPNPSDFPFIIRENGTNQYLGTSFCNLGATFSDGPRIATCANTYKFVRTFTVVDWCNTGVNRSFNQLVKVGDFNGPEITAPTQDLNFDGVADTGPLFFSTNSTDCTSFFVIPNVIVTDDCSATTSVTATILPNGSEDVAPLGPYAPGAIAQNIPRGVHTLIYRATDVCGNQADPVIVQVRIDDATAPVAICEDGLNISIGGGGVAVLRAGDIDRASYDECSAVTLAIARDGGLYSPSITLDCDDISALDANGDPIADLRLSLRVTDLAGNVNYCWLDVVVEDKTAPVCIAPAPRTVTCADLSGGFPQDLNALFAADPAGTSALLNAQFGSPNGLDNCPTITIDQSVVDNRTSCGTGTITRTFTVTDAQDLVSAPGCRQVINVLGVHDYTIVFPGDVGNEDCIEPTYNGVTFEERGCDLITVATDIDTFLATADECYKLRITYEVLNWCEYNTESAAYLIPRDADNDNNLNEATYLHVIPRGASTLNDDLAFLDRDNNRTNNTTIANLDTGDGGILAGSSASGYGQDGSRGAFRYRQYIKIYDETAPVLVITTPDGPGLDNDGDCLAGIDLSFTLADNCSPNAVNATAQLDAFVNAGADGIYTLADFVNDGGSVTNLITNNGNGNYSINLTNLPLGRHAVRIVATDGCGNTSIGFVVFELEDNKAPTPICINGLTVTLMPDGNGGGMAAIWASDYIASPATDCSGEVKYAIYRAVDALGAGFEPSVLDTGLVLTCDDDATTIVRIYAIDPAGQSDYCETTLLVQANNDQVCGSGTATGNLVGSITTAGAQVVPGVNVSISGNAASSTVTDINGMYAFTELAIGDDYTVAPSYDSYEHHINGVSTFDLVLMSKHILGIDEFSSPFEFLAGDANDDGNITVQDIIAIRRLILDLDQEYRSSPGWRFVDANFIFPNNMNPWATTFPEVFNVNNLAGSIVNGNFVAIMIGNIDGNGLANLQEDAEGRSSRRVELATDQVELIAGNTYAIPFTAAQAEVLEGFQGTLNLENGIEFAGLEYGAAQAASFNVAYAERGIINMSYYVTAGQLSAEDVLFTLNVYANTDAKLSDVLSITSDYTVAEAYTTTQGMNGLDLSFAATTVQTAGFELFQNTPNPVADVTTIAYSLPTAAPATITVQDITGKVVLRRSLEGVQGKNVVTITSGELNASGMLTYTIVSGDFTATKKMVVLN